MRRGHGRAVNLLLALLAVVGTWMIAYLFVSFDEPLRADTRACLEPIAPPADARNMFLAILGLSAADGVRPQDVGARLASSYEQALREYANSGAMRFDFGQADLDGALTISSLCDTSTVYCIDKYLEQQSEITRLVDANKHVLENYRELAFLDGFAVTLTPDLEAPVPPSENLVLAQRLRHASLAVRAQRSKPSQIAEELVQDLELTRRLLAQSDHLIYKMTAAVMVVRSLHLISQISDAWPKIAEFVAEDPAMISAITAQEFSLASSLCSEFRLLSSVFLRREQVVSIADIDSVALGTLSALAYKPNATVNLAFADLNRTLEKLDALAPDEFGKRFAKHIEQRASNHQSGALEHFLTWPWNPIGHILVQVARPQYERWYTRLYDLEGLRRIVAMKLLIVKHALGDEQIQQLVADRIDGLSDPYRDAPLVVNFDQRTLSFQALSEVGQSAMSDVVAGDGPTHRRFEIALPVINR